MLLYLIRHGESAYNAEGRIQGQSDIPLSDFGRRQSEAVATALAERPIEAVFSSPLARAMQTAAPIAARLALPVQTDSRLMEINAGMFQDKLRTEIDRIYPAEIAQWTSGDPDFAIPGGESRRQLGQRGLAALEAILQTPAKQALVVSHGGLLAAALKALLEIPARRQPFTFQNCSINRIDVAGAAVRILSLNEVEHLREVGLGGSGDL